MAETLEHFPAKPVDQVSKWLNGQVWQLSLDDLSRWKNLVTARSSLLQKARSLGWQRVVTRQAYDDNGECAGLIIRAEGKNWSVRTRVHKELNAQLWDACLLRTEEDFGLEGEAQLEAADELFTDLTQNKYIPDNSDGVLTTSPRGDGEHISLIEPVNDFI